jgi:hypothetical protein
MLHEECQIEAEHRQPELPFSQFFGKQASAHFRKPIVESGQHAEERSAKEHIMKMGHEVISVVHLPVHRRDRERNAA